MDIENREYFKNTKSLNGKVSVVRNTGLFAFIFINEYIDHHFYVNKTTCKELCANKGGRIGRF